MKEPEISVAEAARRLGVTITYVYTLVWAGKLAARKENGRWLVSAEEVGERAREGQAND